GRAGPRRALGVGEGHPDELQRLGGRAGHRGAAGVRPRDPRARADQPPPPAGGGAPRRRAGGAAGARALEGRAAGGAANERGDSVTLMKAAVLYGKEDVRIERVKMPSLEPGDILLRTKVALTCGTDAKVFRRGYHARMIVPPAVFGHELAGVVEQTAPGVEGLEPGVAVGAANSAPCGGWYYCRPGMSRLCAGL